MKTSDGALVRTGQVYLARASKGEVAKSGWIKVTVVSIDEANDTAIAQARTQGFGSPVLGPKDLKSWKTQTDEPAPPTERANAVERPPSKPPTPIPDKATGFDYIKHEFVSIPPREWKDRAAYVQKNGGMVKTVWGLGETFFYMPGKNRKQLEIVAEAYDVGFEKNAK